MKYPEVVSDPKVHRLNSKRACATKMSRQQTTHPSESNFRCIFPLLNFLGQLDALIQKPVKLQAQ